MKLSDYVSDKRITREVIWPGTEKPIRVLLLNCADIQEAAFAARDHFAKRVQPVDLMSQKAFADEWEHQLVARMLLPADSERPQDRLFRDVKTLREHLTPDLIAFFMEQHGKLRDDHARELGLLPALELEGSDGP